MQKIPLHLLVRVGKHRELKGFPYSSLHALGITDIFEEERILPHTRRLERFADAAHRDHQLVVGNLKHLPYFPFS